MAKNASALFFFNSDRQGWSERYWITEPNISLTAVAVKAALLLAARVKLLGKGITLPWAYCSYDDEFRDVQPVTRPEYPVGGVWNSAMSAAPLQPNCAICIRCSSGDHSGKFIYMSGAPQTSATYPPLYAPPLIKGWVDAMTNFKKEALQTWGWKGLTYDPLIVPIVPVLAMTANVDEWQVVVTDPTPFYSGLKVKLSNGVFKPTGAQRANRVYLVTDVAGSVVTLSWGGADLAGATYLGSGTLQAQAAVVLPFTAMTEDKLCTHKRGVGFGRQVGRRRKAPSP